MWQVFGRLHLLLLHFPIALLVVAATAELTRPLWGGDGRRRDHDERESSPPKGSGLLALVAIGAIGATTAAASGWVYAANEYAGDAAVDLHRWLGVASAGVALLALLIGTLRSRATGPRTAWAYRFTLLTAAVGVGAAGHVGGELVHGNGFLLSPLREAQARESPNARPAADERLVRAPSAAQAPAPAATRPGAATISFDADVMPILEASCIRCHGPDRQRGGLRLDALDEVMWFVQPGEPGRSLLVEVIELPDHDPMHMPKNEPSLPDEQIETIRAWIAGMNGE